MHNETKLKEGEADIVAGMFVCVLNIYIKYNNQSNIISAYQLLHFDVKLLEEQSDRS